ncbi:hypothetical protein D3Z53_24260 [Lachnospiraceae bacterium]|nr:transglutaminase domain-containing protein [uncultured Schaedlerella sp.]NBI61040.1 hypothetical protein [Lachnospiraceae bacterium]
MTKWKKNAKRVMVFFLVFGFIGGMMDHLRVTVSAAGTEGEQFPGTVIGLTEDKTDQSECVCVLACTEETKSDDCSLCREDVSACKGRYLEAQPDENGSIESENTKPEDTESKDLDSTDKDKNESAGSLADLEAARVEELIKELPSLEELKAFDQEALKAAYEQIQKAFDAYENLEAEQKAMLPGAEEELKELLEYFTTLIMPLATDQQIEAAWNAMTTAMVNWDREVDLSAYNLNSNDWGKIWPDVAQDNPDLFYVLDGTYYTSPDGIVQKCTFTYNSQYNQNSVAEYRAAINNVFSEVIGNNMTDEQKATALHDYLVQHMVYDQNANNNLGIEKRNAYEALVNGIGVCQGYTLAYAALLKEAGIEVEYCKSQTMNHIWNYVKLNGSWYHADLTYDDATAASQTGETGYVKHEYFLLSDSAMRSKAQDRTWDANNVTCTDTRYDNSWHKTAPITESAIYAVNGSSYYLKKETVINNENICSGASLMKRDANGNETQVAKLDIENLGSGWPKYAVSFSRLSCSKGVLYFNVGNSVYSFNPASDKVPGKIYQYEDQSNRIVTGLLANSERMTLEIYNPNTGKIEDKIVVSMTGMEVQKDFAFPVKTKTVTYGDADFTMTAKGAAEGSSVSYSSSDPSVASVDTRTGLVRIQKAGSAVITATASAVGNYEEASSSYQLTVSPKALAWDVSALEAADRLDQIKDREATLFGELKLEGILEKDAKLVLFDCPAEKLSGVYETAAEGSQKVALSWKNAQDEAVLEGNGKENYTMPRALPEIMGRISAVQDIPQEPVDGNEFKIEVESGISKVPDAFLNQEHLNTPGKIETEMKLKIREKDSSIAESDLVIYDVELLANINGAGWEKVTKDNFPADGLSVTLPYPSGTGRETHHFTAAHMFTEDMNGYKAGDVEYPEVANTNSGITFKVNGLSPIAVGWKDVKDDSAGDGGNGGGSNGGNGSGSNGGSGNGSSGGVSNGSGNSSNGGSGSAPNISGTQANSPVTGDNLPIMLYVLLAAAAFGVMTVIYVRKKKN